MTQSDPVEELRLVRRELQPVWNRLVSSVVLGAMIGLVVGGVAAWRDMAGLGWAWLVIAPVVLLAVRVPGVFRLEGATRVIAKRRASEQFRAFALTDQEIRITTALGEHAYQWPAIIRVVMPPGYYGLMRDDDALAWIRRAALTPDQDAEIAAFLAGRGLLVPTAPAA